jgi:hypothetical protein
MLIIGVLLKSRLGQIIIQLLIQAAKRALTQSPPRQSSPIGGDQIPNYAQLEKSGIAVQNPPMWMRDP